MMDHDLERCEAYLNGTLPLEERHALEARMREDAGFAREFEDLRFAYDLVNLAGEQRLKAKLTAIHGELNAGEAPQDRPTVIRMRPRRWLAIAASILFVIVAAYLFMGRSRSPQDLYAEHMMPYAGPDRTRSGGTDLMDSWSRFAELYEAGRYDDALVELDISTVRIPNYMIAFYRGQCLLLKKDPDPGASMAALEQVLTTDNDLHAAAQWYIGLAALKAADPATARTHFEILRNTGGYKHEEAARILEQLPPP